MKRTPLIIAGLCLILVSGLAACRSGTPEQAAAAPIGAGDPVAGEKIYARVCMTCHGPNGKGVAGLSQDITHSELVASKTDQFLVDFIKLGGAPDEPLVMLPKAGNPTLTDQNLYDVVAHLRALQR
jgi:mono/diheme cytochrome c family protein